MVRLISSGLIFTSGVAQFFGTVPLITDPAPVNKPRATPEELFGQIAFDLKSAIELMPATRYENIPVDRLGHATKWGRRRVDGKGITFFTRVLQQR